MKEKTSLSQIIQNCLIWQEKTKKNFGGKISIRILNLNNCSQTTASLMLISFIYFVIFIQFHSFK